mgnify:CR=1 FL=1
MRIAVWHNLPSGGGKRALWNHVRGLLARGHHVEAFCPAPAAGGYLPLGDLCPEHALPLASCTRPWAPRFGRWWAEAKLAQREIAAHRAHARLAAARGDRRIPMVTVSTAHPAKFPDAVEKAVGNAKRELIHDHIEHCLDDDNAKSSLNEIKQLAKYL